MFQKICDFFGSYSDYEIKVVCANYKDLERVVAQQQIEIDELNFIMKAFKQKIAALETRPK